MDIGCARCLGVRLVIQLSSSGESSRDCEEEALRRLLLSGGLTVPEGGFNNLSFVLEKSLRRREGTPAETFHEAEIWDCAEVGRMVFAGRIRRRSQWWLCARRGTVERISGRMTHRRGFAWIMGVIEAERRVDRKFGMEEVDLRLMMWTSQTGILMIEYRSLL